MEIVKAPDHQELERYPVNGMPRSNEWWEDVLRSLRERRNMVHYGSTRYYSGDPHLLGMAGEIALADFYRALLDTRSKLGGDKGVDLELLMTITGKFEWIKHDVKAAQGPAELLVPAAYKDQKPARADCIYILAKYLGKLDAELLAWEWGHVMLECPTEFWSGNKRLVHHKSRYFLRSLSELTEYYRGRWRWFEDANAPKHGYPAAPAPSAAPVRNKSFCGECKCGAPGLYFCQGEWFCNEHRVI